VAKLREVCRNVRSKNAGPFWVTIDICFDSRASFGKYCESPALSARAFADAFGVDAAMIKRYPVEELNVLKISYPREAAQGGVVERDMHRGQQYVRLLDIELDNGRT
jgi:hypothetical protein